MKKIYLTGNTYPLREEIRAAGGRWDKDKRQWWCTPEQRPAMLALARRAKALPPKKPAARGQAALPDDDTKVIGEAKDLEQQAPVWLAWMGRLTKGGNAGHLFAKLITRDGRKFFWKPAKKITVLRRFEMPLPLCGLLAQVAES